jgi:UDP-3-O-[3-hydroxymyristoyl] N-acetylglucosamine deacetylase
MQHTLAEDLAFEGVGLHTGASCRVRVMPREAGFGLQFRLDGKATFPAHSSYVVETRRATVLGHEGQTVSTVEHLLSALFATGVDNALIEVEGPEIPVMDGSAATFCEGITRVGLAEQKAERILFTIAEPVSFQDGEARIVVRPSDAFRICFVVNFASPIGQQSLDTVIEPDFYAREIAPARTFGYLHEVQALLAAGLAKGGSLDNALVFAPEGPMTPLRWPDEAVRHKTLDLIGDFALLGAWPQCEIIAFKSGHRLHAQAVSALRSLAPRFRSKSC